MNTPEPANDNAPDLQFANHGFAVLCQPQTDVGRQWIVENIFPEEEGCIDEAVPDCMWPLWIEHRYLEDIVLGARAAGLVCNG